MLAKTDTEEMENFSKMQRMKAKVMTFIAMRQERWLYWWKTEILQNNYDFLNDECNDDDDDDDECGLSKVVHFSVAQKELLICVWTIVVSWPKCKLNKNKREKTKEISS